MVEADGERCRSMGDEYDCLMMELIISAIVPGEPAAELRAALSSRLPGLREKRRVFPSVWWSTVLWDCAPDRKFCSPESAVTSAATPESG